MNEEKCIYCDMFAFFKELLLADYSMEDAFHTVLRDFEVESMEESFKDGYISAMAGINKVTKEAMKQIKECNCDECCSDCE